MNLAVTDSLSKGSQVVPLGNEDAIEEPGDLMAPAAQVDIDQIAGRWDGQVLYARRKIATGGVYPQV
jgi:hypothetical protein